MSANWAVCRVCGEGFAPRTLKQGRLQNRCTMAAMSARIQMSALYAAWLVAAVALAVLPAYVLLAMLSLPLLVRALRASELGATGQQRAIAMIDLETAQLHATFGLLLVLGLVLAATIR